jgi:hypothetical protein
MSFGKASAPAPPNYAPIAAADAAAAERQFQLGEEQLQWGRDQFNAVWPYAQQYMASQVGAADIERQNAADQQAFYNETYKPIESTFAKQALDYNTPANAEQKAGAAMADVANTFDANRKTALAQLESFGIDPSQTRFGALDLDTRVRQAAASAAAGTLSRLSTEATGLSLEGEAIKTGRGYPTDVANAYRTATDAGSFGIGTANSAIHTGSNATGSPTSYFGLGNQSRYNQAGALNMGFNNAYDSARLNASLQANTMSGIGQLIGGGFGAAALFL